MDPIGRDTPQTFAAQAAGFGPLGSAPLPDGSGQVSGTSPADGGTSAEPHSLDGGAEAITIPDSPPPPPSSSAESSPPAFGYAPSNQFAPGHAQPAAMGIGAAHEVMVTVHCPGYSSEHSGDMRQTRIAIGTTLPGFRNECRRLFPLPGNSEPRGFQEEEIREIRADGSRKVIDDPSDFVIHTDRTYEFVPLRILPVAVRALVRREHNGEVVTFKLEDTAVPALLPLNPAMLRELVEQRGEAELRESFSNCNKVAVYLLFPGFEAEVPLESHQPLLPAGQLVEGVRLILQPQIELSLDSSYGRSIPFSIRPEDTWGTFLQRVTTAPPPPLAEISHCFALRGVKWLTEDELGRSPMLDIGGVPQVNLTLHPIVECQIFAFLRGTIWPFRARLPGDVPLASLLPDLVRRSHQLLGFPMSGCTRLSLLSSGSRFFGAGVPIGPEQSLGAAGVRGGAAVLLLCEDLTIETIIEPTRSVG